MHIRSTSRHAALLLAATCTTTTPAAADTPRHETVRCAAEMGESAPLGGSIYVAPRATRVAFREAREGQQVLVVDGVTGPAYDEIGSPAFGPGGRVAYAARRGGTQVLVSNGREIRRFPAGSTIDDLQFHPARGTLAYVLRGRDGARVVVGSSIGRPHDEIVEGSLRLHPETGHAVYVAGRPGARVVVAGSREYPPNDDVSPPIIGRARRLAFVATRGNRQVVVDETGESVPCDRVSFPSFDPAGDTLVYAAVSGDQWRVAIGRRWRAVPGRITDICVGPRERRVAYSYELDAVHHFVGCDSLVNGPFETVVEGTMVFSRDGRRLAFEAEQHDQFFVVLDGEEGARYSDVVNGSIRFSPDGSRVAYIAEQDGRQFAVVDGVEGPARDAVIGLEFSPGGGHVAYLAVTSGRTEVVLDGVPGPPCDAVIGDQLFFDSDSRLRYMTRQGRRVCSVEESIGNDN